MQGEEISKGVLGALKEAQKIKISVKVVIKILNQILARLEHIHADLKRIKELEEKKEPIGAIWYDTASVSSTSPYEKQFDITPLFSCRFQNNGPDEVLIQINNTYQFELANGSTYELNYGYPKIRKISLVCESGKTATVEIKGTH